MTNEELVHRIQAGETELYPQLWEQVERFVAMQARRRAATASSVEFGDYFNSGYIAMVAAVKSYDTGQDKTFLGWFAMYLGNIFAEVGGYRKRRIKTVSLDAPLPGAEDMTLLDTIPDPVDRHEATENTMFTEQLRAALEVTLSTMDNEPVEVIRGCYFANKPLAQVADEQGITYPQAKAAHARALRRFRKQEHAERLRPFLYSSLPHVGLREFRTTHTSAVEKVVFRHETENFGFAVAR